ncbi:MAG: 50S ribosomal protein L33 [Candidatus Shapirobacteria bacterium]|nr:50S ribosomal protein L33 [Candidatus Shapirobacteria bacterium]MDD5073894.1 50S ribosomal protein L33 [Candidatus Shapirobacteria bacterium]MDD5481488.1 50S ribosomal protein L33 [Candidatus Shapirobacteria bacterium]
MAKKGNRILVGLVCSVCGSRNYVTEKNKINLPEKITINKYCPGCRKTTPHKETSKLK